MMVKKEKNLKNEKNIQQSLDKLDVLDDSIDMLELDIANIESRKDLAANDMSNNKDDDRIKNDAYNEPNQGFFTRILESLALAESDFES